jgi:peptidoglycan/LPS O-acetylase OafA/YrhL
LRNALLLDTNVNPVMWTIQLELLALPMIFFAFLANARWGLGSVAALTLALAVWSFSGWWFYMFLVGVMAWHLGHRWLPGVAPRRATVMFVGSVLVFFLISCLIRNKWQLLVQTAAAAVLCAVLAFGPRLPAAALLRAGPLRFLGRVSYSFYLLHPLTLFVIWKQPVALGRLVETGIPPVAVWLMLWAATTLAILPLAWLTYRTIELPFIRLGKRLIARRPEPASLRPATIASTP